MKSEFMEYVGQLKAMRPISIEPRVKKLSEEQQQTLREEQDLGSGAVKMALVPGPPVASTSQPSDGDLVYFHYTVRDEGGSKVLASTEISHGGSGCPHAALIAKGTRIPRGWELGMAGMREGQRAVLITAAAYSFTDGEGLMPCPAGVSAGKPLQTEIHLLRIFPAAQAKVLPTEGSILKVTRQAGQSWETPRPPYEVAFDCAVTALTADEPALDWRACTGTLGGGELPGGFEAALNSMAAGEEAMFVLPRRLLGGGQGGAFSPPDGVPTCALFARLTSFVEVRDMTGDGQLLKKKLKAGQGSFPIDAPINDATVRLHYSIHVRQPTGQYGEAVFDTRPDAPLDFTTGEGNMPQGVEMAVKLMLPGERCELACGPKYGYSTCCAALPEGVTSTADLRFDLELVSFEKEGHPAVMSADEIIAWGTRHKEAANALYKAGRTSFASAKYKKTLQTLENFRDIETDDQAERITALKVAILANMAAVSIQTSEFSEAIRQCDAALSLDEDNGKVMLRKCKALSLHGEFDACRECADQILAKHEQLRDEVHELGLLNSRREKEAGKKQKAQFRNFFER